MHVDPQTCYVVEPIMVLSAVMKDSNIWPTQGCLRPAEYPVVFKCSATGKPFSGFMARFGLVATSSSLFESE